MSSTSTSGSGNANSASNGSNGDTTGGTIVTLADGGVVSGTTNTGTNQAGACTTADVRAIFQANCATAACHDSSVPAGGLDLSGADPGAAMANVTAPGCPDYVLMTPGDPAQSLVWLKLTQTMPPCGVQMPIGPKLNETQLGCISDWITNLGSGTSDCETCGGDTCIDTQTDATHCGGCDMACDASEICTAGECFGCSDGETACGTMCVDTQTDPGHCGDCNVACGLGEVCVDGDCQCDASMDVSFAADIEPLLNDTCANRGCHGGVKPQQNLGLATGTSYGNLVGVLADQCLDGRVRVVPGEPTQSYIINKLTGVDMCAGTLMPNQMGAPNTGGMALPESDIAMISGWICAGALDN